MNLERKYNKEETTAINMSREIAELPPITQSDENKAVGR